MRSNTVKITSFTILLMAGLPILFLFQNCGSTVGSSLGETASYSSEAYDAKIAEAPFSFDTTVDQITYMSCTLSAVSNTTKTGLDDKSAFFTFRVGAYDFAGVKISSAFRDYAKNNFKHLDGTVNDEKAKEAVMKAPANEGAQLQVAIRPRTNFESGILKFGTGTPEIDVEYNNISVGLTNQVVVDQIYPTNNRVNYFEGGSGLDNRTIDGSIYYQAQESVGTQVRSLLQNSHLLTVTYTEVPDVAQKVPYAARTDSAGKVNGMGFTVSFGQPGGYSGAPEKFAGQYSPSSVMKSISQVKLSTGQIDSTSKWSCPDVLQYKIIALDVSSVAENAATYCPAPSDAVLNTYSEELALMKRHLPPSKWRINPERKCAVPLVGTCYPYANVAYDGTELCGPDKSKDCTHFISVCLKD